MTCEDLIDKENCLTEALVERGNIEKYESAEILFAQLVNFSFSLYKRSRLNLFVF